MKISSPLAKLFLLTSAIALSFSAPQYSLAQKAAKYTEPTASLSQASMVVQLGHSSFVTSVAYSPDGKTVLTGGWDATVRLWEIETGKELRKFLGHTAGVGSVAYSPDGKTVMSGSNDKTVRLWDVQTGKELFRFTGHLNWVNSVAYSPDSKNALTADQDGIILLWDVETGRELQRFRVFGSATSVAYAPNGKTVLIGGFDGTARLWDVQTGAELKRFTGRAVAFSRDGKTVVTAGSNVLPGSRTLDKTAWLWDAETGRELSRFIGHTESIRSVACSPDGKTVLTGSDDKSVRMWDAQTGRELRRFLGHTGVILSVAYAPDGSTVLTGSADITARLWDVQTGGELRRLEGYADMVSKVAYAPDGKTILTGCGNTARLWSLETGRELRRFIGHTNSVISVAYAPDSKVVLTGSMDKTARLWETETGREMHILVGHSGSINSVACSPDGKTVLTGSMDKTARLWSIETGAELRRLEGHSHPVRAVACSPDGKTVLTGSSDGTARLWDVQTGKELRMFYGSPDGVSSVAYSPDGKTVLIANTDLKFYGSINGTAWLYDVETGKEQRRFEGHPSSINAVAFSPDGKTILTGGFDNTVRLWETETPSRPPVGVPERRRVKPATSLGVEKGRELRRFEGHSNSVSSVAFSPDGKYILTGSYDSSTRLWDSSSGKELCRLFSFRDGTWTVITPEGFFDASSLEEIEGLHWVMSDDPMKTLPLEIFMRDYYEPRLLPRILYGEKFKPARKLSELNRVQPEVKIASVERPQDKPDTVIVTVEVGKASRQIKSGVDTIKQETGVYDLRLFREGQIVGQFPREVENTAIISRPPRLGDAQDLADWRKHNLVELNAGGRRLIRFENIRLPRTADLKQIEFSAYAFNEDRVKSQTSRKNYNLPADLTTRRGRAYVVTIGVNAYENPLYDLKYSVNDAYLIQSTVADALAKSGQYEEVVSVPLVSDYKKEGNQRTVTASTATKKTFKGVLDLLAGRQIDTDTRSGIPKADKLQQARPEDLVLISFSSHGYADADGNFYFLLYDTGEEVKAGITNELLQHALSSEELSLWLRNVDAGEMLMIVDACHSAAAVQSGQFKPGPMGSRGLGQLSYDKGMRILTATQADSVAVGSGSLKQGLLTYALVKDGIEAGKADYKPVDKQITITEWLEYGQDRVPKLFAEMSERVKEKDAPADIRDLVQELTKNIRTQQPSLFNFARKRPEIFLVK